MGGGMRHQGAKRVAHLTVGGCFLLLHIVSVGQRRRGFKYKNENFLSRLSIAVRRKGKWPPSVRFVRSEFYTSSRPGSLGILYDHVGPRITQADMGAAQPRIFERIAPPPATVRCVQLKVQNRWCATPLVSHDLD